MSAVLRPGLVVILIAAAMRPERRAVVVVLLAYLAFSAPHLVFHLGHRRALPDGAPQSPG